MQYLRGKMTAVTSAVRRELEERQAMAMLQQQQPSGERVMKQGLVVGDPQKRNVPETEENSEVKRIKINPMETKTENIVDEEWKRISLGIEKQTRAVHLKGMEMTETKVDDFGSDLKRTIINKPSSESKLTTSGNVFSSKLVAEPQQKKISLSDVASRAKQDQATVKTHHKKGRWDDPEQSGKGSKYDDKRTRQKQSPSYRSTNTPPRGYRSNRTKMSPPRSLPAGRNVWPLKDDKGKKDSSVGKDISRKAATMAQYKEVVIIDDEKPKESAVTKGAEKSPVVKPSSSSQPTSTATTTSESAAPSFRFGWMSKTVRPTKLVKPGVQYGPMPGSKLQAKGKTTFSNDVCHSVICLSFCCSKLV